MNMEKSLNIRENTKKVKLVESGRILFYKYGYRKVTVEEICRNACFSSCRVRSWSG